MFKVINLKPVKGEVPWSRLHEASYEAKPFASASIWSSVIQVHAVDAAGQVLVSRALPRDKFIAWCVQLPAGCIVARETSSGTHHWARKRHPDRSGTAWPRRREHNDDLHACAQSGRQCGAQPAGCVVTAIADSDDQMTASRGNCHRLQMAGSRPRRSAAFPDDKRTAQGQPRSHPSHASMSPATTFGSRRSSGSTFFQRGATVAGFNPLPDALITIAPLCISTASIRDGTA